jgi:hypothetical protein
MDASSTPDAGTAEDAGSAVDSGTIEDAGPSQDGGTTADAGSSLDAGGGKIDAGSPADAGPCGFISVSVDSDAGTTFTSLCQYSWGSRDSASAVGYIMQGGAVGAIAHLELDGCASAAAMSAGLQLSVDSATQTGSFTSGSGTYTDSNGTSWGIASDGFSVQITELDPPGGAIDGTFSLTIVNGNDNHTLTGTLNVCRVADEDLP